MSLGMILGSVASLHCQDERLEKLFTRADDVGVRKNAL